MYIPLPPFPKSRSCIYLNVQKHAFVRTRKHLGPNCTYYLISTTSCDKHDFVLNYIIHVSNIVICVHISFLYMCMYIHFLSRTYTCAVLSENSVTWSCAMRSERRLIGGCPDRHNNISGAVALTT